MKTIVVEAYNPNWAEEFLKAKKFYEHLLEGIDVSIEHVGSTSVEGLWAKPILDIDIIVSDSEVSQAVIKRLKSVDYRHVGNYGVEGREAFAYEKDNKHIYWMTHHLYVCLEGCENLLNHLLLRQHLRRDPLAIEAYSQIKRELAKKHPDDIDAYVDGKTALITEFLKKEGMDLNALNRIESINKIK